MSKSTRLGLRDVEASCRLIGECGELWADPDAWRGHLLAGLSRLTGAAVTNYFEFKVPDHGRPVRVLAAVDAGWRDAACREHFVRFLRTVPNPFDAGPELGGRLDVLAATGRWSVLRQQVCPDADWYRTSFYNDFRRPAGNDGYVMSFRRHAGTLCSMVGLSQDLDDPPLTVRTKRLTILTHRQVAELLESRLTTERHRSTAGLSPRLRQTLHCLLEGDGEKQVAVRLGIRPATVHEYVTRLYRHFGVDSRPELMAYFVHRRPAMLGVSPAP